jgi:hypothetical protein
VLIMENTTEAIVVFDTEESLDTCGIFIGE